MNPDHEAAQAPDSLKLDDSPSGLQRRWLLELNAARDFLKDFHEEGAKVDDEFLGKGDARRLNLYHSDVQTKSSNLSGVPRVRAQRRYADAKDDVARVSATTLDRLLNTDIERESDGYRKALANAKSDWLRPGLGQVRLRYVVESEKTPAQPAKMGPCQCMRMAGVEPIAPGGPPMLHSRPVPDCAACGGRGEVEISPAIPEGERKTFEDVETDHVKWTRYLWTPAEVWEDVRATFYGLDVPKEEWERQFPGKVFHPKGHKDERDQAIKQVFGRAEVWEIWDKTSRKVLFLSEHHEEILKVVDDPLGLPGFFPSPQPLMANATTSKCVPRSTYYLAKPQYDEAHELHRRIRGLVKQAKVAGAYDAACAALQSLLDDAADGKLVPVKNWSALAEKGGLAGSIAFLPLKETVEAIIALSNRLALVKQEIYEITANSDLTRGQSDPDKTATAARGEMRVFSRRVQAENDEYARFASEAQRIRAFLIAKNFDAETIAQRANMQNSEDIQFLPQAIQLLKSDVSQYRIDVDADSLTMTDFDAVQQENLALLKGTAEYFGAVAPLAVSPEMAGFFADIFQAAIAGMRGAERFEPIVDRFRADMKEKAQQPKPPPPPDPAVEREKVKGAVAMQQAKVDIAKAGMEGQLAQAEHAMKMEEMAADVQANRANAQTRIAEARAMPKEREA